MPVTRSCAELAARPHGLLETLLRGDTSAALRLLEAGGGGAASQLALTGSGLRFTALHAAALAGCAEAVPALVAAGAPVDAALDVPQQNLWSVGAAPLRALLWRACQKNFNHFDDVLRNGATALAVAVRAGQHRCIEQLLEAGADPAAGRAGSTAVHTLQLSYSPNVESCERVLRPFLQRGLDPLAPLVRDADDPASLLVSCHWQFTTQVLLDHLEQQRAAGSLQLGSWQRAQQLLLGAAVRGAADGRHATLLVHSIAALEQQLGVAGGAGGLEAAPAVAAAELQRVLVGVVTASKPASLQALLASRLPFDVRADFEGSSLLQLAMQNATSDTVDVCVRLLLQAGAPVTARDLHTAVDSQSPAALTALLSCGVPVVDVSEPLGPGLNWSCPIHRTIHATIADYLKNSKAAIGLLEALTAAGFRPAVYHNVCLPAFLQPSPDAGVFAELDPLALLDTANPQHARLAGAVKHWAYSPAQRPPPAVLERLLHLARGGGWSPAAHRLWPDSFKAAARTLLLCASVSSSSSGGNNGSRQLMWTAAQCHPPRSPNAAARPLGGLPPDVLLQVVRLAAEPTSAWL